MQVSITDVSASPNVKKEEDKNDDENKDFSLLSFYSSFLIFRQPFEVTVGGW